MRTVFIDDEIEVIRPDLPRGRFRSALFDFDGTLSLVREGWPQVMVPMMVAELRTTGTAETEGELAAVRRSVARGAPFGAEDWQQKTAAHLGLQATLRPVGRPPKKRTSLL